MKVSDLMVSDVVTCRDTASLGEAAKLMWEHDIGFLPVIGENGALVGVITDRDGFIAAYFQGHPIWEIPVRTAMSPRIASLKPDAEVDEAEQIMAEFQVHRVPVVKDGKLVGVISLNDLARSAAGEFNEEFEEEVALTLGAISHPRLPETAAPAA
ncbi:MAG: CBS domain-containing protein [Myxococcales bacterium]